MSQRNLALLYGLAFLVPLAATLFLTPLAAWLGHRFGILDHPAENRYHQTATPYLGGLAIACGLVLMGIVASTKSVQLLAILVAAGGLMIVGLIDDRRGLRPVPKIVAEILAGGALWLVGVRAGLFGIPVLDLLLTIAWILAITNALNLLDNMDGLAAGVTIIASFSFFWIAGTEGERMVAAFALALAGASLGFLRHNFPPARIFLGDAGSLMLGFLLAALALKLDLVGEPGLVRTVIPMLVLGVPVFDTVLVVASRIRGHRPVLQGGTDHSSHRLTELGLTGRSVAIITYVAQIMCCGAALFLLHAGDRAALTALVISIVLAAVALGAFLMLEKPASGPRADLAQDP